MSWNHRILAHEHKGEIFLLIHEVHYDENNTPKSHSEGGARVGGDTLKEITWTLNRMKEARSKPILWAGNRFPQEYEK